MAQSGCRCVAPPLLLLASLASQPLCGLGQVIAGKGEKCNPSLPPIYAIFCGEGLYCNTIPGALSGSGTGAPGICTKCTPEKCEPAGQVPAHLGNSDADDSMPAGQVIPEAATVGEGAKCSPSLPPAHAIHCNEGLYCSTGYPGGSTGMPGSFGICKKCDRRLGDTVPSGSTATGNVTAQQAPVATTGNVAALHHMAPVGEGGQCNPSLPPAHAIFCGEGLYCHTIVGRLGGYYPGACAKCTPEKCEPLPVGEGETCNPALPPASAILCSEGLHCVARIRGGYGTCKK